METRLAYPFAVTSYKVHFDDESFCQYQTQRKVNTTLYHHTSLHHT